MDNKQKSDIKQSIEELVSKLNESGCGLFLIAGNENGHIEVVKTSLQVLGFQMYKFLKDADKEVFECICHAIEVASLRRHMGKIPSDEIRKLFNPDMR